MAERLRVLMPCSCTLIAFVSARTISFSSFVWHLAGLCLVQVGRLQQFNCYFCGMLCDSSDMNDALWMCFIPLIQDVMLASGLWFAVDITFL